jgi:hypothetical protein
MAKTEADIDALVLVVEDDYFRTLSVAALMAQLAEHDALLEVADADQTLLESWITNIEASILQLN